ARQQIRGVTNPGGSLPRRRGSFFPEAWLSTFQNGGSHAPEYSRKTLVGVVKENQEKHEKVQYNDHDPLDYYGKLIHAGDTVGLGTFDGIVKQIRGTKVLVYWNQANYLVVGKGEEEKTAAVFGIKWLSEQWVEAKTVTVSGS
ncbi:hypothetical protein, partial [Paenibacillus cymbidii]|uniref:hypothetical protein n=1 Tax=Paenibacillus cymbidii TaxID=1639034 RepID=UPI0014366F2D